ncbi:MAG: cytochrome c [Rhodospirillaceae bacterium]|nr:cytochrome c [Rhodospirillaceae bacterium]
MNRRIAQSPGRGVLVLSLWALGTAVAFPQEPDDDGDVREGRALYESHQCWQCHGYEGQGSVAGVRIAPTLYPYEAFALLVRHTNLMPAYSPNVLSDEQLRLIYVFVQSIPEPPPLEEIPELDFN